MELTKEERRLVQKALLLLQSELIAESSLLPEIFDHYNDPREMELKDSISTVNELLAKLGDH